MPAWLTAILEPLYTLVREVKLTLFPDSPRTTGVAPFSVERALQFPPVTGQTQVLITRIVDGDTVDYCYLVTARGRVKGINAPEMRGVEKEKGLLARQYLETLLVPGQLVTAQLYGRDKYGRVLVDFLLADGHVVSRKMLEAGQARKYMDD